MFCKSCGEQNVDGAKFCRKCGTPLADDSSNNEAQAASVQGQGDTSQGAEQASVEQASAAQEEQAQATTQQNAQATAQQNTQATAQQNAQAAAQQTAQQAAYQQQGAQAQQTAYQQQAVYQQVGVQTSAFCPTSDNIDESQYIASPFASGWADIENSKGWFPRSLLLGLCALVPVLRWVISGYAVRWGREICLGINRHLPTSIFEEGVFVTGAKIWVLNLLYALALFVISCALFLIPIIGPIIIVLGWFAFFLVSPLLDFQVGLSGKISAGFSGIGRAFKLIAKTPIKTFASTLGPSFILEMAVLVIVAIIFAIIFFVVAGTTTTSLLGLLGSMSGKGSYSGSTLFGYGLYGSAANAAALSAALAALGSSTVVLIIVYYVFQVAAALAEIWTNRSLGHLIARLAPEWLAVPGLVDMSNIRSADGIVQPYIPFCATQTRVQTQQQQVQ